MAHPFVQRWPSPNVSVNCDFGCLRPLPRLRAARVPRVCALGERVMKNGDGSAGIQRLLNNNRKWAENKAKQDPEFFVKSAQGQQPQYLWIGCSDSRVVANTVTGLEPGEVFTHRNVGNIVMHTDMNCMSVIEFAVQHLKVKHIIVCGHYGCGACAAALKLPSTSGGLLNCWISHIRTVRNMWAAELRDLTGEEQVRRLCELNTEQQTFHMCTSPAIQSAWASGQELYVHGVIYDLADGRLTNLMGPISSMEQAVAAQGMQSSPAASKTNNEGVGVDIDLEEKLRFQMERVYTFEEKLTKK